MNINISFVNKSYCNQLNENKLSSYNPTPLFISEACHQSGVEFQVDQHQNDNHMLNMPCSVARPFIPPAKLNAKLSNKLISLE